ncbi:prolyl oligopeptidase family serine peptidase [Luteimonas sp. RD2P54]|uniref:Prolyl oligopeptidase family serine peptidase n=1 Tax=Luteimonas endophytica TaxID=3042023 RepID=A0ABT6JAY7_9GAMM|nr:prolyl oligopeptidase family serine peptidase [Luteimonas endophytica]MDH5823990.1 prolyl oligopeptidase family serine peptidase [Luteimonas endophytica]
MTRSARKTVAHRIHAALAMVALLLPAACATLPAEPGRMVEREVEVDGRRHAYRVFVPAGKPAGAPRPVVLFLHGSGERGSDPGLPTRVGLGPYVQGRARDFPAIVVFPQAPAETEWSDNLALAEAALDAATREFGGDPRRTYLTGMSMGGYGTWELAMARPGRFAALVPICAGLEAPAHRPTLRVRAVDGAQDKFATAAQRLRDTPVWIFHGAKDDLVPPEQSRRMAAALAAAGAADARYTEFADANHNSWDPAYATPELWDWLFAQRLEAAPAR